MGGGLAFERGAARLPFVSERQARVIGPSSALVAWLFGRPAEEERSILCVPLVSRGQTVGVVTLAAPAGKVFTRVMR